MTIPSDPAFFLLLNQSDRILEWKGPMELFPGFLDWKKPPTQVVSGIPFMDWIEGDQARQYLQSIFDFCRLLRKPLHINYRQIVDSHLLDMELSVEPNKGQWLALSCRVRASQPLPFPVKILPGLSGEARFQRCHWCQRIHNGSAWIDWEALCLSNQPSPFPDELIASPAICEPCRRLIQNQLRGFRNLQFNPFPGKRNNEPA